MLLDSPLSLRPPGQMSPQSPSSQSCSKTCLESSSCVCAPSLSLPVSLSSQPSKQGTILFHPSYNHVNLPAGLIASCPCSVIAGSQCQPKPQIKHKPHMSLPCLNTLCFQDAVQNFQHAFQGWRHPASQASQFPSLLLCAVLLPPCTLGIWRSLFLKHSLTNHPPLPSSFKPHHKWHFFRKDSLGTLRQEGTSCFSFLSFSTVVILQLFAWLFHASSN